MKSPRTPTLPSMLLGALSLIASCATTPAARPRMGTISDLSIVEDEHPVMCAHHVPEKVCARCHPELAAKFKAVDDWCPGHDVPESQCLVCHPELTFTPLPALPADADVTHVVRAGEDLPSLAPYAVAGKITVFDFYARWCVPCRQVDRHVYQLLGTRKDIAYRKLDIVSWDTPLVKHYLAGVAKLPYVTVYGKDGRSVGSMTGLDLGALDELIARAGQ